MKKLKQLKQKRGLGLCVFYAVPSCCLKHLVLKIILYLNMSCLNMSWLKKEKERVLCLKFRSIKPDSQQQLTWITWRPPCEQILDLECVFPGRWRKLNHSASLTAIFAPRHVARQSLTFPHGTTVSVGTSHLLSQWFIRSLPRLPVHVSQCRVCVTESHTTSSRCTRSVQAVRFANLPHFRLLSSTI